LLSSNHSQKLPYYISALLLLSLIY